jgi:hypothetical protein
VVDINRRWFVFGSVAAVAAAALPLPVQAFLEPPVERLPSAHVFLKRAIRDFYFSFNDVDHANDDVDAAPADESATVRLFVQKAGERTTIFEMRMNVRSSFRWAANVDDPITVMPEDTFEVEIDSNHLVGLFTMIADDTVDEGPPITVVENHRCPRVGPVEPMYVHVDNSLEARLARKAAVPIADDDDDIEYEDDFPEDDYDV